MDFFRRLLQQLTQVWQGLTLPRRIALVLATALCVALVVGVGFWASQTEYRNLYTGLSQEDAAAITARLTAQNIPYRLTQNGTAIQVPAEQVAQVKIDLAAEGLPGKTGKGFELFDESPLGMTPFTQQVNYTRALQAELSRTIMQIEPVAYARVIIARSEPSPFVRDQKPPTASVVLRLKPGQTLSRSTAAGIAALVAKSVEGLTPDNVTIMDASGRVLSEAQTQEGGQVSSQLDYRRSLESYLASKAESMLAQVLGPGRAIVRVAADINFQRLKERRETVNPDLKTATSEKITNSRSTSNPSQARGATGTASNVPAGRTLTSLPFGPGQSTTTSEESIQTEYAVSRTIQEIEDKLGSIDRITVAALVDLQPGEGGKSSPPMSLKDAQEVIKDAIGFKTDRDEIKVSDVRLAGPLIPSEKVEADLEKMQYWQNIANLVRNGSLALGALVVLVLGWMLIRRVPRPKPPEPPPPPPEPPERARLKERLAQAAGGDPQAIARALARYLERSAPPP